VRAGGNCGGLEAFDSCYNSKCLNGRCVERRGGAKNGKNASGANNGRDSGETENGDGVVDQDPTTTTAPDDS